MNKTELLAMIVAVNGGLWLFLALVDWVAVRIMRYRNRLDVHAVKATTRRHTPPPAPAQ